MGGIILPLVNAYLMLGQTVDITKYKINNIFDKKGIFNDISPVENGVEIFNATYYVLQDSKIPYESLGIPIDAVNLIKSEKLNDAGSLTTDTVPRKLNFPDRNKAAFLVVADYRMTDLNLKNSAVPRPGWQNDVSKRDTHYVEKMHNGGRLVAMTRVTPSVEGDAQIVRRILTDVMGESGQIGEETVDLWQKALKTVRENPDVRGNVYATDMDAAFFGFFAPVNVLFNFKELLRFVPRIPEVVSQQKTDSKKEPVYVTLRQLHDLDKQYPALEKNLKTEEYLKRLDEMVEDLTYTLNKFSSMFWSISTEDKQIVKRFEEFETTMEDLLYDTFPPLIKAGYSIYKEVNSTAFERAFKLYEIVLEKGTESYFSALNKLYENYAITCENRFLKPTRGFLEVQENEVVKKDTVNGGVEECQEKCVKDERCRSVGYRETEAGKECWIYYRSTVTATINTSGDMKIFDRTCEWELGLSKFF